MLEITKFTGEVNIKLFTPLGVKEYDFKNLIVQTGLVYLANRLRGTGLVADISHIGIGVNTGDASAQLSDTTLTTEVARSPLDSTTQATITLSNDAVQYVATFAPGTPAVPAAIKEAALFNAGTGGTMLSRVVFPVINKGVEDGLQITWKVGASN